jgi:uncharacterized membrane protein
MSQKLIKDLQELVTADVITGDVAGKIQQYYATKKQASSERFNIVLAILGASLIGSGIILLVAHNWDEMSRPVQSIFAFIPVAIGQTLCMFTLLRKTKSTTWKECSSVILLFGIGSCMALISQIYHINKSLSDFILTWLFLTAPMVYIMRSSLSSLFVICCATWYAILVGYKDVFNNNRTDLPYFYLVFFFFIIPHYYQLYRFQRTGNFFHFHNWFLVISAIVCLGTFASKGDELFQWIFIGYCALFGNFYLLGESVHFRENRILANPFRVAGVLGIVIILLSWSYQGIWNELNESTTSRPYEFARTVFFYLSVALMLLQLYLLLKWKKQFGNGYDPLTVSVYLLAISVLAFAKLPLIGLLIINAWILAVAMYFIRKGAQADHLGILNFGLMIIASLAVLRFFDDTIPFVWRGLFFVATGIGFVAANYLLLKKRKSVI